MKKWKELLTKFKSPIARLETYMLKKGLIKPDDSTKFRDEARTAVRDALKMANDQKKPPIEELFNDVYDHITPNLVEQRAELKAHLRKYGDKYDLATFKNGEKYANE